MRLRFLLVACCALLVFSSCTDPSVGPGKDPGDDPGEVPPVTVPVNLEVLDWGSYQSITFTPAFATVTATNPVNFSFASETNGTGWKWYVDGVAQGSTASSFSFTPAAPGQSTVDVTVLRDGVLYSGSVSVFAK